MKSCSPSTLLGWGKGEATAQGVQKDLCLSSELRQQLRTWTQMLTQNCNHISRTAARLKESSFCSGTLSEFLIQQLFTLRACAGRSPSSSRPLTRTPACGRPLRVLQKLPPHVQAPSLRCVCKRRLQSRPSNHSLAVRCLARPCGLPFRRLRTGGSLLP